MALAKAVRVCVDLCSVCTSKSPCVDGYCDIQLNPANAAALFGIFTECITFVSAAFQGTAPYHWYGLPPPLLSPTSAPTVAPTATDALIVDDTVRAALDSSVLPPFVQKLQAVAAAPFLQNVQQYQAMFWIFFLIAVLYPLYTGPAVRAARNGHLGLTKEHKKIKLGSRMWFYYQGLTVFQGLFTMAMSTMFGALTCDYDEGWPPTLRRVSADDSCSFEPCPRLCWTIWPHGAYVLSAFVAVMCYYPVCSLLIPQLQFKDMALDIKARVKRVYHKFTNTGDNDHLAPAALFCHSSTPRS
jgi:hypothetical protein